MSSLRERSCLQHQIPVGRTASTPECLSSDRPMRRTRSCSTSAARTAALTVRSVCFLKTMSVISPCVGCVPFGSVYVNVIGRICLAGGDQGVLNSFFNTWATADISKHLPFIYNLSSIAIYSYLPAFKQSVQTRQQENDVKTSLNPGKL